MSTLVLALTAGLALGSGPEAVSVEVDPPLDLSGEWEGEEWAGGNHEWLVRIRDGRLCNVIAFGCLPGLLDNGKVTNEGSGRLRVEYFGGPKAGIYRREGERLTICLPEIGRGRPDTFSAGDGQTILTLRRVRPGR